jgi:hypothetical protein
MAMKNNNAKKSIAKQDPQYADKLNEMIRNKAFELFQKRGATSGREMDDWLEAEKIVKRWASSNASK